MRRLFCCDRLFHDRMISIEMACHSSCLSGFCCGHPLMTQLLGTCSYLLTTIDGAHGCSRGSGFSAHLCVKTFACTHRVSYFGAGFASRYRSRRPFATGGSSNDFGSCNDRRCVYGGMKGMISFLCFHEAHFYAQKAWTLMACDVDFKHGQLALVKIS